MSNSNSNIVANPLPVLSRAEIVETILTYRSAFTVKVLGEPGISKSSIARTLASVLTSHRLVFINGPDLDIGDTCMTVPVRDGDNTTLKQVVNSEFCHSDPLILFIDEVDKSPGHMAASLNALIHERRVGPRPLHDDTIIVLTSNLQSDGVGDRTSAHSSNRVLPVQMAKPTSQEAVAFGQSQGWHPVVCRWMEENTSAFDSYVDDPENKRGNTFIFNPRLNKERFVSMRSLEKASIILNGSDCGAVPDAVKAKLLSAAIGASAGSSMATLFRMFISMPRVADALASPMGCVLPSTPAAQWLFLHNAVSNSSPIETVGDVDAAMTYITRFGNEYGSAFYRLAQATPRLQPLVRHSRSCRAFAVENTHLI